MAKGCAQPKTLHTGCCAAWRPASMPVTGAVQHSRGQNQNLRQHHGAACLTLTVLELSLGSCVGLGCEGDIGVHYHRLQADSAQAIRAKALSAVRQIRFFCRTLAAADAK